MYGIDIKISIFSCVNVWKMQLRLLINTLKTLICVVVVRIWVKLEILRHNINWFRLICISYFIWKWVFFSTHWRWARLRRQQRRQQHITTLFIFFFLLLIKELYILPRFFHSSMPLLLLMYRPLHIIRSKFGIQKYSHNKYTCKCYNFNATIYHSVGKNIPHFSCLSYNFENAVIKYTYTLTSYM